MQPVRSTAKTAPTKPAHSEEDRADRTSSEETGRGAYTLGEPKEPARIMRLRFDCFVERLIALGEPSGEDFGALLAGADLVKALSEETDDFGAAAPGVGEDATFAQRLAALTDEAFEAAARLIEDEEDSVREAQDRNLTAKEALRHAVSESALDPDIHAAIALALLSLAPVADPAAIAKEFM